MVVRVVGGGGNNLRVVSDELRAHERIVVGDYVPREDFVAWFARHKDCSEQGKRYARTMSKKGYW